MALFFAFCKYVETEESNIPEFKPVNKKDIEDYREYAVLYRKTDDSLINPEFAAKFMNFSMTAGNSFMICQWSF